MIVMVALLLLLSVPYCCSCCHHHYCTFRVTRKDPLDTHARGQRVGQVHTHTFRIRA